MRSSLPMVRIEESVIIFSLNIISTRKGHYTTKGLEGQINNIKIREIRSNRSFLERIF